VGHHILVADDDEHILFQVTQVLRQKGYSVETARDGKDALDRALAHPPDLLITDVMMPRLDGWSLVRELRMQPKHPDLPVIFLTALTSEDEKTKAFRLGADDYVIKPFRLEDFVTRVAKTLAQKKPTGIPAPKAPPQQSSGLRGDLSQVGLSTLLVLVEMERKTGVLSLTNTAGQAAEIVIRDGKILRADMQKGGQLQDAECIYQVLRWKAGDFDFAAKTIDAADRIKASTTHLLMEGARLIDEDSAPVKLPNATPGPAPAVADDDALDEWEQPHNSLVIAKKVADAVKRTARSTLPPINERKPEGAPLAKPEPAAPKPKPEPPREEPRVSEPPVARRRGPNVVWLVLAVVVAAAGTAIPYVVPPPAATNAPDVGPMLQADANQLATAIDASGKASTMRAKTLAATPLLRAGIETDAATIRDLANSESMFQPVNGETLEIFQLRDGARVSLLRVPQGAAPLDAGNDESNKLVSDGKALAVVASAPIAKQTSGVGGLLAVSTPCDLASATHGLASHVVGASLVGLDRPVVLVPGNGTGRAVTLPLGNTKLQLSATVAEAAPAAAAAAGWIAPARYAAWGLGSLLIVIFALSRKR
jgi:DNA-binding response OmpR family regulator